jgi:hypothetical protein
MLQGRLLARGLPFFVPGEPFLFPTLKGKEPEGQTVFRGLTHRTPPPQNLINSLDFFPSKNNIKVPSLYKFF